MMSSQDLLFSLAVEKLPKQLASAMVYNGLMHPLVLSHYPRKSVVELGLVPAQEVKVRKTIEGDIAMAAIGHGGIFIGGGLDMEAATIMVGVDPMVQNHETDVGRSVQKSVTEAVSASLLNATTHDSRDHFPAHPSFPPSSSSSSNHQQPNAPGPHFTAASPNSTIPATSSTFPAVPASSSPIFGVFADSAKMGDVSMDFEISKSVEVPGQVEFRESRPVSIHAEASSNGLSESRRQSQSELRPHQNSHPGVTPHSRLAGSDGHERMNSAPSSTTLLHHALVQDGAVPSGFQQEFETLAPAIMAGTAPQARKAASTPEFHAALILHERSEELKHKVRLDKVADQLVQPAAARRRKYRATATSV